MLDFRNLRITLRMLLHDRLFSLINISGLAIGFAISLLIFMFVRYENSYELYNPLSERIGRLTMDYYDGKTLIDQDADTYAPLAPLVHSEFPEVVDYAVAQLYTDETVEVDGKFHRIKRTLAASPSFLTMMNHRLTAGDHERVFKNPQEMILTENMSERLFGTESPVGKTVKLAGNDFKVVGLVNDCPSTTHLKFDLLFSYQTLLARDSSLLTSWNNNNQSSYVLLKDKKDFKVLDEKLKVLSERLMAEDKVDEEYVIVQPIQDIHLHSNKSYEPEPGGHAASINILFWVAFLVIGIAIVNYINLTTSKSLDRAKEVGIRKVVGSSIGQLRMQFMRESLVINLLAGSAAVALVQLGLPHFIMRAGLPADYQPLADGSFWLALFGLISASSLLSGLFPAFILSSFPAITMLKGKFSHTGFGVNLRKALVVLQFGITTFLLVQTVAVAKQLKHMRDKDLGVDIEQTIVVRSPETPEYDTHFDRYKNALLQMQQIESVALSNCVPGLPTGQMGSTTGVNLSNADDEHNFNFYLYFVDHDFIPTLGMELLAGENYREHQDNSTRVIVNEEAIRLWGIKTPAEAVGQQIDLWGKDRTIAGVVKNYNQLSPKANPIPLILLYPKGWHTMATIRLQPGDIQKQVRQVESLYASHFPSSPFEYFFLDQEYGKLYASDQKFQAVFQILSSFGILIACLGLFGLVYFTVSKRAKEISVRKVLGADTFNLVSLLSREFILLVAVSIAIAIPITYLFVKNWVEQYAYRIDLAPTLFAIPAFMIILLALITVIGQTYFFSLRQPITAIRNE